MFTIVTTSCEHPLVIHVGTTDNAAIQLTKLIRQSNGGEIDFHPIRTHYMQLGEY